ncbi:MAG TPA: peptide chain release factor N(5)-glutamine methyltransferase [Clostridia bacterium]|nr:peptide chain release factor N(5)-glutamine methyltransferase [Clostridia bacterium]
MDSISIRELLKKAAEVLKKSGSSDTPVLDAELLLIFALNQSGMAFDRIKLVTQQQSLLEGQAAARYMELIDERSKGKPVQYITRRQEFMGFDLYVRPGVLIPRADTETVVEKVIELSKGMDKPVIVDMCTGSGAIAVSLAGNIPGAGVWAVDISDYAMECCSINVRKHDLEDKINIVKSDLFDNIREERLMGNVDIIVSNPPYIESAVIQELDINVRYYEPHLALDGGKDGLVYYRRIVKDSVEFLRKKGILAFEIGHDQGDKVKNIMEESGCYDGINIEKDLAGYDRCVWGYKKY